MRTPRFLNMALLSALLGASAFLYAQDTKQQEQKAPEDQQKQEEPKAQEQTKPSPDQEKKKPTKKEKKEQDKQAKQANANKDQNRDDKSAQGQPNRAQPGQEMQHEQQGQAENQRAQEGQMQQQHGQPANAGNGGGKGGRIPDDKFRANFGRGHSFKAQTVFVSGQQQFAYGGYNFQLVDAWPSGWAYTDDCYIDYIDGEYFLIDLLHPGMRIAVIVVM